MTRCYYFGCWNEAGHFLHKPGGVRDHVADAGRFGASPFGGTWNLDGTLAPRLDNGRIVWAAQATTQREYQHLDYRTAECPQGQYLIHKLDNGFTAMAWWDRTQGDKRGACNSVLLLEGEHDAAAMIRALLRYFPHVAENLRRAGVELVEVRPAAGEKGRGE